MLLWLTKKLIYSISIILGVMLLTFALFQLAAGDPAGALLGKNPTPREVENLRRSLGGDLPVIYGNWRQSEVFNNLNFTQGVAALPGVKLLNAGEAAANDNKLHFSDETKLILSANFAVDEPLAMRVAGTGDLTLICLLPGGETSKLHFSLDGDKFIELPEKVEKIEFEGNNLALEKLIFFRRQSSGFNSQLGKAITELCKVSVTPQITMDFFNFGETMLTRESIKSVLWRGIGPSLLLMIPIFIGELLIGITLALIAVMCRDTIVDRLLLLITIASISISYLVLIIAGQWFLGYYLNLFPVWGYESFKWLLLPIIIGIVSSLGEGVRFYRTIFIDELSKPYLRTATAKGVGRFKLYGKHLLKNAAIPIISRASSSLPFLFTGSLLLESFFGIPGLGYLSIEALNNSDLQLLKALVVLSAVLFIAINFVTDFIYAWVDPRMRKKLA